ncbi:NUDIX hydrolase [Actibacterium mucosum]|nr:NUDIX hydrolase [Actibacterium mucosum]
MGQRGKSAAFMPNKYVFPGGAVDAADADIPLAGLPSAQCMDRLTLQSGPVPPVGIVAAAIRELWEETGLILGKAGSWPRLVPADWREFAELGYRPDASALRFIFRAITPPGAPRRFDARFFLADADHLANDPDDFTNAQDELSHLHWVPLAEARKLDLPFVTEVVLAEIAGLLRRGEPDDAIPFFDNTGPEGRLTRLA